VAREILRRFPLSTASEITGRPNDRHPQVGSDVHGELPTSHSRRIQQRKIGNGDLEAAKDGVDAALAIHETVGSKVIFITGSKEPATAARILLDHPSGVLYKPVSDRQLRGAIEKASRTQTEQRALKLRRERRRCYAFERNGRNIAFCVTGWSSGTPVHSRCWLSEGSSALAERDPS
jgi:hypothetical protein